MPKAKRSVEEIRQDLKQEIIRLGIQDNPSRTVYQKEYQRGVAPSPNGALKATGMKWQELMHELGFDYDGAKNSLIAARGEEVRQSRMKSRGLRLTDPKNLRFVVNTALELMHDKKITDAVTFEKMVNSHIDTTYRNLSNHGYSFEKFKKLYAEKYGRVIGNGKWRNKSSVELLIIAVEYMHKNNIDNLTEYDNTINKDELPSAQVLMGRSGMTYAELSEKLRDMLK